MEEEKPPSEHALYTSVVVKNQKMEDPDRQLRISRIKRQIAVLNMEMNSIRQTIARGSGGGLFARLDGRLGAEEQLTLYTTRMKTLQQELDILNTQGMEEVPLYDAISTLTKTQTVTSRRNPRGGDEPKSASGRKVKQMEMAVDFLMDDEVIEDNTMDLQGEIEADIYTPAPRPWLELLLVRNSMWFRRKCVQLGLAWGSIQSHMSVNEYNKSKRAVIIKNFLLLALLAILVLVIQQTRHFSFRRARHETISERIHASGISFQTDMKTKDSPQYKALDWITASDPANLDADDKFLLQRYALAVFWFSTINNDADNSVPGFRGSNRLVNSWRESTNWMSEKGICLWFGVQCHHRPGTDIYSTTFDANDNPTVINITDNRLRGSLPRELFLGLPDVRWFSLGDNELVGTVPTEVGAMTKLDYLSLANNQFSGELGVLPWKQLKQLQRLELHRNGFWGSLPTDFEVLTRLSLLSLYDNKLTGPINEDLTNLTRLLALYLDNNGFTGTLPSGLYGMHSITDLRLGNNQLKGKITPFLDSATMSNLRYLQVHQNLFTGSLPSNLALLTKLVELRIHGNLLDGTIPTQIGRMHDLESLQLDGNQIVGKIPTELGLCLKLKAVLLDNNKLESTIPTEIANLKDLAHLRLQFNALTGEIPANIGEAWRLQSLFLQDNKLEGAIPESIGGLHDLKKLRLENNELVGSVPPSICSLKETLLVEISSDCGGDNPAITCSCCTVCIASP